MNHSIPVTAACHTNFSAIAHYSVFRLIVRRLGISKLSGLPRQIPFKHHSIRVRPAISRCAAGAYVRRGIRLLRTQPGRRQHKRLGTA